MKKIKRRTNAFSIMLVVLLGIAIQRGEDASTLWFIVCVYAPLALLEFILDTWYNYKVHNKFGG